MQANPLACFIQLFGGGPEFSQDAVSNRESDFAFTREDLGRSGLAQQLRLAEVVGSRDDVDIGIDLAGSPHCFGSCRRTGGAQNQTRRAGNAGLDSGACSGSPAAAAISRSRSSAST